MVSKKHFMVSLSVKRNGLKLMLSTHGFVCATMNEAVTWTTQFLLIGAKHKWLMAPATSIHIDLTSRTIQRKVWLFSNVVNWFLIVTSDTLQTINDSVLINNSISQTGMSFEMICTTVYCIEGNAQIRLFSILKTFSQPRFLFFLLLEPNAMTMSHYNNTKNN